MDGFDDVVATLASPASVVHGLTQARVLRAIARHAAGGVRRDLAQQLQVSPGTVSKAVLLAIEVGLVEERQPLAFRPGRPLVPLSLSSTRFAMIGIAIIAGTQRPDYLLGTIIGLDGTPFPGYERAQRYDLKDEEDPDGTLLLSQLGDFGQSLLEHFANMGNGLPPTARLLGCGVTLSGHIDHESGTVRTTGWGADVEQWTKPGFAAELSRHLGIKVTCDNDVSSLAVRLNLRPRDEKEDPGNSYALLAVLDHGVGGALVLHDRTRRGYDSMAGEAGHLPVGDVIQARSEYDDKPPWSAEDVPYCHCEDPEKITAPRGHVQAFAAPDAIVARAIAMRLIDGDASGKDATAELSARPRGESAISRLFYQGGVALGRAIVSAINWVNPGRIVLYLPPALAETNPYLAGCFYQRGLFAEIRQNLFSVNYIDRLIVKPVLQDDMEERLAAAAAYLVFAHLLETIAAQPGGGRPAGGR